MGDRNELTAWPVTQGLLQVKGADCRTAARPRGYSEMVLLAAAAAFSEGKRYGVGARRML